MRAGWLAVAVTAAALAAPSRAGAQVADTSIAVRLVAYQDARVSPALAVVFEYLLTPLGYVYAHQAKRGIWPAVLVWGGASLVLSDPDCNNDSCSTAVGLGATALIVGKVWGMIGAHSAAVDYNRGLRERLRLVVVPDGRGARVGIALPLP